MAVFRYYSAERPVTVGSVPRQGLVHVENFDGRVFIPAVGCDCWGAVEYDHELTGSEVSSWELISETGCRWYVVEAVRDRTAGKMTARVLPDPVMAPKCPANTMVRDGKTETLTKAFSDRREAERFAAGCTRCSGGGQKHAVR